MNTGIQIASITSYLLSLYLLSLYLLSFVALALCSRQAKAARVRAAPRHR